MQLTAAWEEGRKSSDDANITTEDEGERIIACIGFDS